MPESTAIVETQPITRTINIHGDTSLPADSAAAMTPEEVQASKSVSSTSTVPNPLTAQPTTETTTETQPDDSRQVSKKFAALSKKEKALRQREETLKQKETTYAQWEEAVRVGKKDPIKFNKTFGITVDDFINASIGQTTEVPLEEQIKQTVEQRIKALQEETFKTAQTQSQEQLSNQINSFKNTVLKPFLNNDNYEMINATYKEKSHEYLWAVVDAELRSNPRNFTNPDDTIQFITEQANKLESYLTSSISNTKKFGSNAAKTSSETPGTSSSKTLTNKLSASTPVAASNKHMTPEQSKRNAAKWLQERMDEAKRS